MKGSLSLLIPTSRSVNSLPTSPRRRRRNMCTITTIASILALSMTAVSGFQNDGRSLHVKRPSIKQPLHMVSAVERDPVITRSLKEVYFPTDELTIQDRRRLKASRKGKNGKSRTLVKTKQQSQGGKDDVSKPIDRLSSTSGMVTSRKASNNVKSRKKAKPVMNGTYNRSSTMPGFRNRSTTGQEKKFLDGVRIYEGRTGKKFADSPSARRNRKKENGEAMYRNSASVPDSLVHFADQIHRIERITPSEEISLGLKTQEAIRIRNLHKDLEERLERKPTDEEWCAAAGKINLESLRQALDEGLDAKNKLVTANLRMVQGVVNVYIRNGLGAEYNAGDMMQEGIMALMRAADKFDPKRGFRFSTYAMYWIRSAVKRSQIVQSRVIPVPQRLYENHKRILRVEKELRTTLGRKPTKKEIGDLIGMSEVQVTRCITAMAQRCFSLDQEITNRLKPQSGNTEGDTLIELVESKTDDADYNHQKREFLREDLIQTLNQHLRPDEVEILLLRYGLMDEVLSESQLGVRNIGPLTIAEVSSLVGLKPDKVRRMINKSLKQLKVIIGSEWNDYDRELQ